MSKKLKKQLDRDMYLAIKKLGGVAQLDLVSPAQRNCYRGLGTEFMNNRRRLRLPLPLLLITLLLYYWLCLLSSWTRFS